MRIAIFNLPEELTPQWDKQPLGDQVVINVVGLLESGNTWHCKYYIYLHDSDAHIISGDVPGLSAATLSLTCRVSDVLVSFSF